MGRNWLMIARKPKRPLQIDRCSLALASILTGCGPGETELDKQPLAPESHVWPHGDPSPHRGDNPADNPWVSGFEQEPGNSDAQDLSGPGDDATGDASSSPDTASGSPTATTPTSPGSPPAPPLLTRRFEQYFEGNGSDKMLVISGDLGSSPSPCTVEIYSNGGTSPWRRFPLPDAFPQEGTLTLCTPTMLHSSCSLAMTGSVFNGNDALVIQCGAAVMDSFGRVGEDPGVAWIGAIDAKVRTEGQHLVRCGTETDTNPGDFFDVSLYWVKLGNTETPTDARARCPGPPVEEPPIGMGGAPSFRRQ